MSVTEIDEPILEPDLPIIDTHHHVWVIPEAMLTMLDGIDHEDGVAIARTYRLHKRYLVDELLADLSSGHNFVATVHAEAHSMYRSYGPDAYKSLGEVEFINGIGAMADSGMFGPTRFCAGMIGGIDLRLGDEVAAILDKHLERAGDRYRGVRPPGTTYDNGLDGLKHVMGQPGVLADGGFRNGVRHLARHGLTLDVILLQNQLGDVVDLAREFPDQQIILNHTGCPLGTGPYKGRPDEQFASWRKAMLAVAGCDNIALKVGGLGMALCGFPTTARVERAGSEELARDWGRYVEAAIEMFGSDRCMFESNFPIDGVTARYPVIWNSFKRIVADYSPSEKEALFSGTAKRIYRLNY